MDIKLHGEIVRNCDMCHERIYMRDKEFILETQTEMMTKPDVEVFSSLDDALLEMLRRT